MFYQVSYQEYFLFKDADMLAKIEEYSNREWIGAHMMSRRECSAVDEKKSLTYLKRSMLIITSSVCDLLSRHVNNCHPNE